MKHFNTIEELHEEWQVNGACSRGREFNRQCKTLQEVFEKCPWGFRLWRLQNGYLQFAEYCDWNKLDGWDWIELLKAQPQFSVHCDWSKLDGLDWIELLYSQPKFSVHCDWNKLCGWDWAALLAKQPQFLVHCDWSKLGRGDWRGLLRDQPQFREFKPESIVV